MRDKRKYKRIKTRIEVKYHFNVQEREFSALSKDLSLGGMCIRTRHPVEIGEKISLVFNLEGEGVIKIRAVVKWHKVIQEDLHENGIEFINIKETELEKITDYVEHKTTQGGPDGIVERRSSKRVPLGIIVNYMAIKGVTEDISVEGLRLLTDEALPEGQEAQLTFFFPNNVTVLASGQIMWRKKVTGDKYCYGIQLTKMKPADSALLKKFIEGKA